MSVAGRLVARLHGRQVRLERRLGVEHDQPAAVQADDEVGAYHAGVGAAAHLFGEVAVVEHAGGLHDATQLVFAPAAADLRGAQGGHQLPRLGAQLAGDVVHRAYLFA